MKQTWTPWLLPNLKMNRKLVKQNKKAAKSCHWVEYYNQENNLNLMR